MSTSLGTRPLILVSALLAALAASAPAALQPLDVELIAHRGLTVTEPENSLEALQAAIALGISGSEIDVRTTRDGVFVLMHDPILDRMTTGKGSIADTTLAEIRALSMRDRQGRAIARRVPTLDEALALAARHPSFALTLDLKAVDVARVAARVVDAGLIDRVVFFTGGVTEVAAAKKVKAIDPRLKIAVDLATWWKTEGLPTFVAHALDVDVLFAAEWNFPRFGFTEGRGSGARVHVFLAGADNLPERLQRAAQLGVHAVSTDRADLLVPYVRSSTAVH